MVLVLSAVVAGCGGGKSGAEAAARELIEAARSGDADAVLAHCDLKGMYETALTDYGRGQLPYDRFLELTRRNLRANFAASPELEYKDLAAEVNGAAATVTVAIRTSPSAEWIEQTLTLTRVGGAWKLTTEGFQSLMEDGPTTE
jgi:hypothetical protein